MIEFGCETVGQIELICEGRHRLLESSHEGEIKVEFRNKESLGIVLFKSVSSMIMADEAIVRPSNYIYTQLSDKKSALYECIDSSYLDRVKSNPNSGEIYRDHRHFIFFDENFLWHVTCNKIEVE